MRISVLGLGRVGGAIAADLSRDRNFSVAAYDVNPGRYLKSVPESLRTYRKDLSDRQTLLESIADADIVINALPGFMGFSIFESVIMAGKNIVDIAFFPEDPFALDKLARDKEVTAIADCGVAPGMSNLLIGYAAGLLDEMDRCEIYVGGLPVVREWPYEYKAVFSPLDVLEEYTRPARFQLDGRLITRPALSDPELMDFAGIGTLEAFNTDGLRTLLKTIPCPNMIEKTLRYPGHIEKMKVLRETGFFNQEEIPLGGKYIRPIDLTAQLLFPIWELKEGEADLTVMRVMAEGRSGRQKKRYTYNLLDRFDVATGVTSMARTTGYTATMMVRLLAEGKYSRKGVSAPEFVGQEPDNVKFILTGLEKRGIFYRENIDVL